MPNTYSPEELQILLEPTQGRCFTHLKQDLEVQHWDNGIPYLTCARGHSFSPEYYRARDKGCTVQEACAALEKLLQREVTPHTWDLHAEPLVLPPVDPSGFVESLAYWDTRGITPETLALFKVGSLHGMPVVPFYDFQGNHVGWFERNPDIPINAAFIEHNLKCKHLPADPENWETQKLHCPPFPLPDSQPFVVVVEGVVDVMSCWDAGFWAASTNGASFTPAQVAELKTLTDQVVVFTDNDHSGRTTLFHHVARTLLFPFFKVRSVTPLGVKDPNQMPADAIRALLTDGSF